MDLVWLTQQRVEKITAGTCFTVSTRVKRETGTGVPDHRGQRRCLCAMVSTDTWGDLLTCAARAYIYQTLNLACDRLLQE